VRFGDRVKTFGCRRAETAGARAETAHEGAFEYLKSALNNRISLCRA